MPKGVRISDELWRAIYRLGQQTPRMFQAGMMRLAQAGAFRRIW